MPPSPERRRVPMEEEEEEEMSFHFDEQTEEERKLVRRRQRHLFTKMNDDTEAMEDPFRPEWRKYCQENSEIFKTGVRYARELQMDGKIMQFIGDRAEQQMHKLLQVPRYDPLRVTRQLRRRFCRTAAGGFDWHDLGIRCGAGFCAVPSNVQFLNGPLQADFQPRERVVRQQRRKASQEDVEEDHPEEQQAKKKNGQASASEKAVRKIYETLKRKHDNVEKKNEDIVEELPADQQRAAKRRIKEEGRDQVDATRLLVNPASFTQTVENIFHFSFLVTSAKAKIEVVQDRPVVAPASEDEQKSDDRPPARQAIVSFTMEDFRRLCRANNLKKGYLPHRSTESAEATVDHDEQEVMDDDEEKSTQGVAEQSSPPTGEQDQPEEPDRAVNDDDDDDRVVMNDDDEQEVMMNDDDEKSAQDVAEQSSPPTGEQDQSEEPDRASPIIVEGGASVISLRSFFDDSHPPASQPARRVTQESFTYEPYSDSQSNLTARRITQETFQPEETDTTAAQYSMRYEYDEDWL